MNKLLLAPAIAAFALAVPAAAPAQRVGAATVVVVDTQRIYRECTACLAAQAQLQQQATALQSRVQQLGAPLQTEANAIQTAGQAAAKLTGAARTAAEAPLQARVRALEARQNTANQQIRAQQTTFERNQQFVSQQINTRLGPIITSVMTARGANLAVDRQATLSAAPAIDVTNDVLTQLNQQLPSVSVTAPAPATPPPPAGR